MKISEKQIIHLLMIAQGYIKTLAEVRDLLSDVGMHNERAIGELLMEISNQQSEELKEIE